MSQAMDSLARIIEWREKFEAEEISESAYYERVDAITNQYVSFLEREGSEMTFVLERRVKYEGHALLGIFSDLNVARGEARKLSLAEDQSDTTYTVRAIPLNEII